MNKKSRLLSLIIVVLIIIGIGGWRLYNNQNQITPAGQTNDSEGIPVSTEVPETDDFTATFEIITNGTRRIFTSAMYQNQSTDVFIQNPDPSIVYVKKAGITWADFFETLPFSVNKTCLVTGTKQTFCSNEDKQLRFYINGLEEPNALDLKIQPGDALRITYGD
jgi:hypothetical protein